MHPNVVPELELSCGLAALCLWAKREEGDIGVGNHALVDAMQWEYDGMVDNAARDYILYHCAYIWQPLMPGTASNAKATILSSFGWLRSLELAYRSVG